MSRQRWQLDPRRTPAFSPLARLAAAAALTGALAACTAGAPTGPDGTRPGVRRNGTTTAKDSTSRDSTSRDSTTRVNSGYQNPLV